MSDSRQLRIDEMKRLLASAQASVEQLSAWRRIIVSADMDGPEKIWLLQCIDNRRALMLSKINQFSVGIETAREYAREANAPEVGALYIDGQKL